MIRSWIFLAIALAAVVGVQLFAAAPESRPSTQPTSRGPDKVVFFDDFSGKELDRTKWNVIVTGQTVNNEQQAYVDSADTIYLAKGEEARRAANGALVIRAVYKPGYTTRQNRKFDFISGRIDSREKVTATYGTFSARMILPAGSGLWPAFWALGNGRWPDTGEIDIMENVGVSEWISAAMHGPGYSGNTPLVKRYAFPKEVDITQWHVYSVDWTKDELVFRVDGTEFYRVTRAMVEAYGMWAFDNPKYLIFNMALGGVYPASINKITSPHNGLPQETVDLIKADKAKVLVDWVKITQHGE